MPRKTKPQPVSRAALRGEADPRLVALSVSIQDDAALFEEGIRGSKAHVAMLAGRGIVPRAAARRIRAGLDRVRREFAQGRIRLDPRLEDVHTHVERQLCDGRRSVSSLWRTPVVHSVVEVAVPNDRIGQPKGGLT